MGSMHDLVNHKKMVVIYKTDARNGKSVMKLVRMSILRPLTFIKCVILEQFESLKNLRELSAGWQSLFSIKSH